MKRPKLFADSGWRESWIELAALFALTTLAGVYLLQLHWLVAMLAAPFLMLALLVAIMLLVQSLWLAVLGLEKAGTAIGLRKSPLA